MRSELTEEIYNDDKNNGPSPTSVDRRRIFDPLPLPPSEAESGHHQPPPPIDRKKKPNGGSGGSNQRNGSSHASSKKRTSTTPPPKPRKQKIHLQNGSADRKDTNAGSGGGGDRSRPGKKSEQRSNQLSGAVMQELKRKVSDSQGKIAKVSGRGDSNARGRGRTVGNTPLPPPPPPPPPMPDNVSEQTNGHAPSTAAPSVHSSHSGKSSGRSGHSRPGQSEDRVPASTTRSPRPPRSLSPRVRGSGGRGGPTNRDKQELNKQHQQQQQQHQRSRSQRRREGVADSSADRRQNSRSRGRRSRTGSPRRTRGDGSSRSKSRNRRSLSRPSEADRSWKRSNAADFKDIGGGVRRSGEGDRGGGGERRRDQREFSPPSAREAQATLEKILR